MRKWIIPLLLVVTLGFTLLAVSGGQESIVICASSEQFRNDALQEQLSQRFPQYNIVVMYMPTGKAAAKIYAEGENSEVDIVLGLDTGYTNKISPYLEDISGLSRIPYLEGLGPENNQNKWVTWERFSGAIVVNTQVLEKYGLEAPKSYEDLLKPEYQGLIAMPDPKSSGTGYFFYLNWVNTMGEEKALQYVDALHNNIKQFTESGSGPIRMLRQGEIAVGLGMTFQAVEAINDGCPLEIYFPETGSPYSLTSTAALKGHLDKRGVCEVFDFIINEFLVYDKEMFSPELIYEGQVNKIPNYPANVRYADMTGIEDIQEKERLLALWKY